MTRSKTTKTLLPLVLGAAAVAPASHAWASTKKATIHAYKGSVVTTQWGPIQATVYVRSKKIVDVKVSTSTHTARSSILDGEAIPTLRQEVLQAQSSHVNLVSGATTVSQAYLQSVESALVKAHLG
jgi:uncharacterized protein with FMN-binding domain